MAKVDAKPAKSAAKSAGGGAKAAPKPAANAAAKAAAGGDLEAQFREAAANAQKLPDRPDNDTLLRLYAYYKQGSEGDVKGEKPGFFDFVGAAKYDAWSKLKGTAQADARKKYVELVKKLGG